MDNEDATVGMKDSDTSNAALSLFPRNEFLSLQRAQTSPTLSCDLYMASELIEYLYDVYFSHPLQSCYALCCI